MTLDEIKPGEKCRLLTVGGEGVLRRRLLDMGFYPTHPRYSPQSRPHGRHYRGGLARIHYHYP